MIKIQVKTELIYTENCKDTNYDDIYITKEDLEVLACQKAKDLYCTGNVITTKQEVLSIEIISQL